MAESDRSTVVLPTEKQWTQTRPTGELDPSMGGRSATPLKHDLLSRAIEWFKGFLPDDHNTKRIKENEARWKKQKADSDKYNREQH